ncbi:hypothetical protein [Pedobacter agri]|uniref:hypothetical protein n=1 Tax=Pedobacter agri TaxID=454586 RepID=UPI00292FC752|nr:hypothetical protein [Pedobacter agri]
MNKGIILITMLTLYGLSACRSKTGKQQNPSKPIPASENRVDDQKKTEQHKHVEKMTFIKYNDDGDYFQFLARKGDSTLSFINETDTNRNLNRGDQIQITWRDGTATIPGDKDAKMPAQLLVSVEKISDGPVSAFRIKYGRKLKYTWSTDENYLSSYLDKIYLLIEYYLSRTKNPLLQAAIKHREELTYSIESTERHSRNYNVIGIAPVGSNGSQIVQWLYIAIEDNRIFEYDLPEDRLMAFY